MFLTFVAMAMAELGSAAPTAGGLYCWTFKFSFPRFRRLLSWLVGCELVTHQKNTPMTDRDAADVVRITSALEVTRELKCTLCYIVSYICETSSC